MDDENEIAHGASFGEPCVSLGFLMWWEAETSGKSFSAPLSSSFPGVQAMGLLHRAAACLRTLLFRMWRRLETFCFPDFLSEGTEEFSQLAPICGRHP